MRSIIDKERAERYTSAKMKREKEGRERILGVTMEKY